MLQDDEGISVSDRNVKVIKSFEDMGLRDDLLRGIFSYGFEKPSAIQQVRMPGLETQWQQQQEQQQRSAVAHYSRQISHFCSLVHLKHHATKLSSSFLAPAANHLPCSVLCCPSFRVAMSLRRRNRALASRPSLPWPSARQWTPNCASESRFYSSHSHGSRH